MILFHAKVQTWKLFQFKCKRISFGWFTYAHSLNNQTSANYRNIQMNWWAPKRKLRSSKKPSIPWWLINRFHKSKLTSAHRTWFLDTEHWIPTSTINLYCFDHRTENDFLICILSAPSVLCFAHYEVECWITNEQ